MTRHSGLGRGLGALIPSVASSSSPHDADQDAVIDLTGGSLREVPVKDIVPNEYQPRKHLEENELQSLVDSIKELGILQPILVRPNRDRFELIAGERRWRAACKAGLATVPVIVREAGDVSSLEQALVENLHRQDLNPLDEASAYRQLIDDFGMTHEAVAKRVGKSRVSVTNLLRLLQLSPRVQKMVIEGVLSEGHARALLGLSDSSTQLALAEKAVKTGMTVRETEDLVRSFSGEDLSKGSSESVKRGRQPVDVTRDAASLEWQERLSNALSTRVTITTTQQRGRVVIEFADLVDLERIGKSITNFKELSS